MSPDISAPPAPPPNSRTRRFALLGDPVSHSKSPAMHAAAYRWRKLPHTYEALRVGAADLKARVDDLRAGVFHGLNVTVPHKRRILEHVDIIDDTARTAGAANTLVRRDDGAIAAYNTDVSALAEELRALAPERTADNWRDATLLVLGSGGAARSAIVAAGLDLGVARVVVRARSESTAHDLADNLRALLASCARPARVRIDPEPFGPHPATDRTLAAVIQATSAGMTGAESGEGIATAVAWDELSPRAVVYDVVYAPPETPFLQAAAAHGIRGANGMGMLARQGSLAFELWLGGPAPYNAMLTALL